jgi:hypothetical protein
MNVDVNTHWSSELYIVPKGLGQIYKYLVGIEDIFTLIASSHIVNQRTLSDTENNRSL